MKKHIVRWAGAPVLALVLALALAISMSAPVWGVDTTTDPDATAPEDRTEILTLNTGKTEEGEITLTTGDEVTLKVEWNDESWPKNLEDVTVKYIWECTSIYVDVARTDPGEEDVDSPVRTLTAKREGTARVTIAATATWTTYENKEATPSEGDDSPEVSVDHKLEAWYRLTVTVRPKSAETPAPTGPAETETPAPSESLDPNATPAPEVTGISLPETLEVERYKTAQLTPKFEPEGAKTTVMWQSSNTSIATVDRNTGLVTGVKEGSVTVTAISTTNSAIRATCKVIVTKPTATGIAFENDNAVILSKDDFSKELSVVMLPEGAVLGDGQINWTIQPDGCTPVKNATITAKTFDTTTTVYNDDGAAGDYIVTAEYNGYTATKKVTVSGIILTKQTLTMVVGGNDSLAVAKAFGYANDGTSLTNVDWVSSNASAVSVMGNGDLFAWQIGESTITANRSGYTAQCVVTVVEDKDSIIGPYSIFNKKSISPSNPLILGDDSIDLYTKLQSMSQKKTGQALAYITNVTVSTTQGRLYYNYASEADPGTGIAASNRFTKNPTGAMLDIKKLYFVPVQGFKGIAEITFNGWSVENNSFSGVIRVEVGAGDGVEPISYRTRAGEPAWFMTDDFNAYCQNKTGRSISYVTFNLPQTSQGVLYYNYVSGTGTRVATTTQISRLGQYKFSDVCFVPNDAFVGDVTITFRGVDTSGEAFDGTVVVTVDPSGSDDDPANVTIHGERGEPVTLQSNLFNDACKATIKDTLAYVTFKLPAISEGTLYYNYRSDGSFESRVNATTRYYFSGVPSINGVTFVPASDTVGRVAITYTGYGTTGTSYTGILYIGQAEEDYSIIHYSVSKNGSVTFNSSDFNTAGRYQMGVDVDYVRFELSKIIWSPDAGLGALYYNYRSSNSYGSVGTGSYYVSSRSGQRLDLISFRAGSAVGTVTIPYTAYSGTGSSQKFFTGSVVIQVGYFSPADVNLYCSNSERVGLSSSALSNVCHSAMGEDLAYIEITGLPDAEKGHLYLDYYGFGTGTAVKEGDVFYCAGTPGISQLSFVPRAGFSGTAEITYIGYGYKTGGKEHAEQASGRIVVNVTKSATSWFTDMNGYEWAIDSVEYLRKNGTVGGVGGTRFDPAGIMTRGDFAVMLVRAYGLTASGNASFNDVPADSYYADAVRIVAELGIVNGYNGNFYPKAPLTRQDAMVMIYNTLKAGGIPVTNGLAADFSVYLDEKEIAAYAREAMGSLVQMGVVKGDGNSRLQPLRQFTRAETAVLLHTIMTL